MEFENVVAALKARKGTGDWQVIAKRCNLSYDTVSRIASGETSNPGILTVRQIAAAMAQLAPVTEAKAAAA